MRTLILMAAVGVITSCVAAPPPPEQVAAAVARDQAQLADYLNGRVPSGPPVTCLSAHSTNDMTIINQHAVGFRDNSSRVYINDMRGGCPGLRSQYALVTRQIGTGLCSGEIANIVDPVSRIHIGSCVFGEFRPFSRPGG